MFAARTGLVIRREEPAGRRRRGIASLTECLQTSQERLNGGI